MNKLIIEVEVEDYVTGITPSVYYYLARSLFSYPNSQETPEEKEKRITENYGLRNLVGIHLIKEQEG